jgi:hypothetical protein
MQISQALEEQVFWSDTYRGRSVSIFNRFGRWHVYLDHVLQHNVVFASPEDAIAWLTDRIDQGFPSRLS